MNSPIQWFLFLVRPPHCAPLPRTRARPSVRNRKRQPSPPARWPSVLSPPHCCARSMRTSGYPSPHACHIRHAAGTHELLVYPMPGQDTLCATRRPNRTARRPSRGKRPSVRRMTCVPRATAILRTAHVPRNNRRPGGDHVTPGRRSSSCLPRVVCRVVATFLGSVRRRAAGRRSSDFGYRLRLCGEGHSIPLDLHLQYTRKRTSPPRRRGANPNDQ
ncbi:hypothetical protein G1C96_0590 [Bifidobacterium sp. DSM 109958]|uniref:Uncharacterized protein n=1 Tax=Bifidobacterium moraviense TaxID=2675323 RepID=A0A7Y0F0Y9_9BIFI|nr:hypothetical protein [Bifidobacterium sp. DSM 109958]